MEKDNSINFEKQPVIDNKNKQNITFNLGVVKLINEGAPYVVKGPPIDSEEDLHTLMVRLPNDTKKHERLCYTTCVDTMRLIFENMTIRSSSLTSANLNDKLEQKRVGISQFACGRFITCFSHISHESVPFWAYYGGKDNSKKVLLKFKNCALAFKDVIHTDYCLVAGWKKLFFYSDEYKRTLRSSCTGMSGLPQINADFDIRNYIRSIEMLDVEYLPTDSRMFSEDYSGKIDVDFGAIASAKSSAVITDITAFSPECLGKQKTEPWDYEKESRILSCLYNQEDSTWDYIDLRLKDDFFRDLIIVINPWEEDDLRSEIQEIIDCSPLIGDIKSTITIVNSEIKGTLNL